MFAACAELLTHHRPPALRRLALRVTFDTRDAPRHVWETLDRALDGIETLQAFTLVMGNGPGDVTAKGLARKMPRMAAKEMLRTRYDKVRVLFQGGGKGQCNETHIGIGVEGHAPLIAPTLS